LFESEIFYKQCAKPKDFDSHRCDGGMCAIMNTDKKENKIFLIYKEIQMGSVAKSYMRKRFLRGNAQIFSHI
jgi:hypothetical protein